MIIYWYPLFSINKISFLLKPLIFADSHYFNRALISGITVYNIVFNCYSAQIVYIGVMGQDTENQFTLIVWDIFFTPERAEITVLEGQTGAV